MPNHVRRPLGLIVRNPQVRFSLVAGLLLALTAGVDSRQAATTQAQAPVGQITGVVVDAVTKQPIADARVTFRVVNRWKPGLGPLPQPDLSVAPSPPPAVLTASNGAFQVRALPAGEYSLMASKAGYPLGFFGHQQPGETSLQYFDLRPGENATGVVIQLFPGATVAGRVRTVAGTPLIGKIVQLLEVRADTGYGFPRMTAAILPTIRTDDRGRYRIPGVPAGRYFVRISDRAALPLLGDLNLDPSCVFYPNATLPTRADVITVASGEERTRIDFELSESESPVYHVSGQVEGLTFDVPGRKAHLVLTDQSTDLPPNQEMAAATIQADGSFVFPYVPPGNYQIRGVLSPVPLDAFRGRPDPAVPGSARPRPPIEQPADYGPTAWFSESVTVRDNSLTGLKIQARTGVRVTGRITLSPELTGLDFSQVGISARSLDGWDLTGVPNGRVASDGTFSSAALPPGRFVILPDARDNYWFPESAMLLNRETMATGIDVGSAGASGLMVTLTRLKARVTGRVTDATGKARPDAHVLFLRKDGGWLTGSPGLSAVELGNVRTNRFGDYDLQLNAGDYFIVAIAGDMPTVWQDAAFLQSLVPAATKVSLARGTAVIESLTVQVLRKK